MRDIWVGTGGMACVSVHVCSCHNGLRRWHQSLQTCSIPKERSNVRGMDIFSCTRIYQISSKHVGRFQRLNVVRSERGSLFVSTGTGHHPQDDSSVDRRRQGDHWNAQHWHWGKYLIKSIHKTLTFCTSVVCWLLVMNSWTWRHFRTFTISLWRVASRTSRIPITTISWGTFLYSRNSLNNHQWDRHALPVLESCPLKRVYHYQTENYYMYAPYIYMYIHMYI